MFGQPDGGAHHARLVMLEAACLALLREASEEDGGPDGLLVHAQTMADGHVVIDLEFTRDGTTISGESV